MESGECTGGPIPEGTAPALANMLRETLACIKAEGLPSPHVYTEDEGALVCTWSKIHGTIHLQIGEFPMIETSCDDGRSDPDRVPVHICADPESIAIAIHGFAAMLRMVARLRGGVTC